MFITVARVHSHYQILRPFAATGYAEGAVQESEAIVGRDTG
jgi:hypothetical protein